MGPLSRYSQQINAINKPNSSSIDSEIGFWSLLGSHLHGIQREPAGGLARRGAGQQKDLRVRRAAVAHGAVVLPAPAGEVPRQPPPSPAPLELVLHLEAHDSDVVPHFQRAMFRSDQF